MAAKIKFTGNDGVSSLSIRMDGDYVTVRRKGDEITRGKGQVIVWDSGVTGLGVRFTPTRATYIFQDRVNRKTRRITLGSMDDMSPSAARHRAEKEKAEMVQGRDRVAERKQDDLSRFTLADCVHLYLDDERRADLKPRTVADARSAFKSLADWMDRPVREISGSDVAGRYQELSRVSVSRGNLTMRYLSAALNHADLLLSPDPGQGRPLFEVNPVARLRKQWKKVQRRKTIIHDDDFPAWWAALDQMTGRGKYGSHARDFFRFMALTGCRPSEAFYLTWDKVDLERGSVHFTDTKNGTDHELPIGGFLIQTLRHRRPLAGKERVFSHPDGTIPHSVGSDGVARGYFAANVRQLKDLSGVKFTPYDLRRLVATTITELGLGMMVAKAILNHGRDGGDVTAGYNVLPRQFIADAMQQLEATIVAKGKTKAEVSA